MRDGDEITFKVHCIYWAKFAINRRTFFEHNEHKEFFFFSYSNFEFARKTKTCAFDALYLYIFVLFFQ